jgi:hypothetical protein
LNKRKRNIPDENASYGKYTIFIENSAKEEEEESFYVYTKQKFCLSIGWFAKI